MARNNATVSFSVSSTAIDFLRQLLQWGNGNSPRKILLKFTHNSFLFSGFLQGETLRMTTSQEFREFGVAMVNYIADYLDNIRDRPVVPKASSICLQ